MKAPIRHEDETIRTSDLLRNDVRILLVALAEVTAGLQLPERAAGVLLVREQAATLPEA